MRGDWGIRPILNGCAAQRWCGCAIQCEIRRLLRRSHDAKWREISTVLALVMWKLAGN